MINSVPSATSIFPASHPCFYPSMSSTGSKNGNGQPVDCHMPSSTILRSRAYMNAQIFIVLGLSFYPQSIHFLISSPANGLLHRSAKTKKEHHMYIYSNAYIFTKEEKKPILNRPPPKIKIIEKGKKEKRKNRKNTYKLKLFFSRNLADSALRAIPKLSRSTEHIAEGTAPWISSGPGAGLRR